MTLLTVADRIAGLRPQAVEQIRAAVREVQVKDLRLTLCITDAKGDRARHPGEQEDRDAYIRVVEHRPDGLVRRGAKLHISGASFGDELMVIPTKAMRADEGEYAVACLVPVNAPGVKVVNTTYAPRRADARDFPFSGRAHMPERFVMFDDYQAAASYSLMVRHLHDIAGGSIVTAPSVADLESPEVGDLVRKYMGTKQSVGGGYRLRLFHAIRDLTADAYGGWRAVTNIQAGGGLYAQRIVTRKHYDLEGAKRLALHSAGLGHAGT